MKRFRLLLLSALIALAPGALHAQDGDGGGSSKGVSAKQFEKQQAKKKRKEKKEVAKEEKRLKKQHLKHQDKATRKRMKQNDRRAGKHGSNKHRDPWLRRLFTK
jgi:hypothetical protein